MGKSMTGAIAATMTGKGMGGDMMKSMEASIGIQGMSGMVKLGSKTIRELNEKDLRDKLEEMRSELSKLRVESSKGTLRKESGKLKPVRKNIARMLTRINELNKE